MVAILTANHRRKRAQWLKDEQEKEHARQEAINAEAQQICEDLRHELDQKINLLIENFRTSFPSGFGGRVDLIGRPPKHRYNSLAAIAAAPRVLKLVQQGLLERSDPGERYYIRLRWGGEWQLYTIDLDVRRLERIENKSMGIDTLGTWTR